jgi:hypothetical protein
MNYLKEIKRCTHERYEKFDLLSYDTNVNLETVLIISCDQKFVIRQKNDFQVIRVNSWGPFLTSSLPPGVNVPLWGELGPPGWNLSPWGNIHPFVHSKGWTLSTYCLEEWRGEQIISTPGNNFTPRRQSSPWGTTSPQGSNFAPRGQVTRPGASCGLGSANRGSPQMPHLPPAISHWYWRNRFNQTLQLYFDICMYV